MPETVFDALAGVGLVVGIVAGLEQKMPEIQPGEVLGRAAPLGPDEFQFVAGNRDQRVGAFGTQI